MSTPRTVLSRAAAALCGATLLATGAPPVAAQLGAGVSGVRKLEVSTTSPAARSALIAGMHEADNIFFPRAVMHFKRAVDLDPNFGLARVLHAGLAPGQEPAMRNAELDRGVNDAARGNPGEAMTAMAYRAWFRGNNAEARQLFETAAMILPDDPVIAFNLARLQGDLASRTVALREVTTRFPDYAAPFNILAYNLWRMGDRHGALTAAGTYMARLPGHPNSHDTYAELLQWDGRYADAMIHYAKARELDPNYIAAIVGSAEIHQLQGQGTMARTTLTTAAGTVTEPAAKVNLHRFAALSWVADGNARSAIQALGMAADAATAAGLDNRVPFLHLEMGLIDAVMAGGKSAAAHVTAAGTIGSGNGQQLIGLIHAATGQTAEAETVAASILAGAGRDPGLSAMTQAATIRAWILLNQKQPAEVLAQLDRADPSSHLVRAQRALAYQQTGNLAAARSLRAEIINDRGAVFDAERLIAQHMVRNIK